MFERFTPTGREAIAHAQEEARLLRQEVIGTEHLLLGVLRVPGPARAVLTNAGLDANAARERVRGAIRGNRSEPAGDLPFTARARQAIDDSFRIAGDRHDPAVSPSHLLLALLQMEDSAATAVVAEVIDPSTVRARMREALDLRDAESELDARSSASAGTELAATGPVCFACRVPLGSRTGVRTVTGEGDDGVRRVTLVYCRRCGTTLGIVPSPG